MRHDPDILPKILEDIIGIFLEYQKKHGQSLDDAKNSAIAEILRGLKSD